MLTSGRSARWTRLNLDAVLRLLNSSGPRESQISDPATDLLTGHKPAQEDITARNYLDLARLDWLQPDVQKIGDWIEQQAKIAAAKASAENVVLLGA
ncbi:hypothetical protein HMPREF0185_01984 [Brevundimonas diminuta 470-4]|nr:hypothetical protein HMPREF0185_01984 [Brevundimonas diminuta 470-4]